MFSYITDGITSNGGAADHEQPSLKKARLDAPKLSSLLLASTWNNVSCVQENNPPVQYTAVHDCGLQTSLKPVLAIKEEPDYNISSSTSTKVKNINLDFNGVRSVLGTDSVHSNSNGSVHKGLTTFRLGSGMTITSQSANPSFEEIVKHTNIRPMPTLKKMGAKIKLGDNSKKSKSKKMHHISSSISSSIEPEFAVDPLNNYDGSIANQDLYRKLLMNRLQQEEVEHCLKVKALEKQVLAYAQQSNYWTLKIKHLKSGNDSVPLMNGEL